MRNDKKGQIGEQLTHVHEKSEYSTLSGLRVTGNQTTKDNDHSGALTPATSQEKLATTYLLDEEPGEGGKNSVADHVDTTDQKCKVVRLTNRLFKQNGKVVNDGVAARNLLEELGRRAHNHAAEVLRGTTGEEVLETGTLGSARTSGISVICHETSQVQDNLRLD